MRSRQVVKGDHRVALQCRDGASALREDLVSLVVRRDPLPRPASTSVVAWPAPGPVDAAAEAMEDLARFTG